MRILHTEGSTGWGGQEMRILQESLALRDRGHEIIFAVEKGGKLVERARSFGFKVFELSFSKSAYPFTLLRLLRLISLHKIDLIVAHSSSDAWIAGIAARAAGKKIIRLRHLSTKIHKGLNSRLLYNFLADFVVTTSSAIIPMIQDQSGISLDRIACVPTGVNEKKMHCSIEDIREFRSSLGIDDKTILIGTVCFVRSWKGIRDFLQAAALLKEDPSLHWVVVGGGYVEEYIPLAKELGIQHKVSFTKHLENPLPAIGALDIFMLLSTAHEGISQASLQAAYFKKPLVTTDIGGLPEVCLDGVTGFIVPPHAPEAVAKKVLLLKDKELRQKMGQAAFELVESQFLFQKTVDDMEKIYKTALGALKREYARN